MISIKTGSKQHTKNEGIAQETEGAHGKECTTRNNCWERNKQEEVRRVFSKTRLLQKRFRIPVYVYSLWCQDVQEQIQKDWRCKSKFSLSSFLSPEVLSVKAYKLHIGYIMLIRHEILYIATGKIACLYQIHLPVHWCKIWGAFSADKWVWNNINLKLYSQS